MRVEFFPGPVDARLQAAAHEAVVRLLKRNGATLATVSWPFDVRALLTFECEGQRLRADLGFTQSDGPQSISVRLCRADAAALELCPDDTPEEHPAGACRDRIDGVLSALEHDLADSLLGKVQLATAERPRCWDEPFPWSVLSLVSLRRWAPPIEDPWSWRARATMVAAAGTPAGTSAGLAARDDGRSRTALVTVRRSVTPTTGDTVKR